MRECSSPVCSLIKDSINREAIKTTDSNGNILCWMCRVLSVSNVLLMAVTDCCSILTQDGLD